MGLRVLLPTLVFVLGFCRVLTVNDTFEELSTTTQVPKKYFGDALDSLVDRLTSEFLPVATNILGNPDVSPDCSASVLKFLLALRRTEMWAVRMLDSDSRPPSGLFGSTAGDYGDYDTCLEIERKRSTGETEFRGKYCTVYWRFPEDFFQNFIREFRKQGYYQGLEDPLAYRPGKIFKGFRLGVCLPSTCSGQDLEALVKSVLDEYGFYIKVGECDTKGDRPVTATQLSILYFLGVITLFLLVGTLVDIACRYEYFSSKDDKNRGFGIRMLTAFSVILNTEKLLRIQESGDNEASSFRCIHGLKFYSCVWVILGHSYLFVDIHGVRSMFSILRISGETFMLLVENAYPSVNTFFLLSGFLMSYNVLKYFKNFKGKLGSFIFLLLVRRYIRITVPAMFCLAVYLLSPLVVSGPAYHEFLAPDLKNCQQRWWHLLTHINNFQGYFEMCMPLYWYVAVDWQHYMLLWIVPILFLRKPKFGFIILIGATVTASLYILSIVIIHDYQPVPIYVHPNQTYTEESVNAIYQKPFAHTGSYCVGILTAYFFFRYAERKMKTVLQTALWLMSTATALLVIFLPVEWFRLQKPSPIEAGFYAGFHKTFWAACIAWILYACITGRGGFINRLLSWRAIVPLSRLSYGAYLCSVIILMINTATPRERVVYEHFPMLKNFLATLTLSYLFSYLLFLWCECPVGNLEKMIFMGNKSSEKPEPQEKNKYSLQNGTQNSSAVSSIYVQSSKF